MNRTNVTVAALTMTAGLAASALAGVPQDALVNRNTGSTGPIGTLNVSGQEMPLFEYNPSSIYYRGQHYPVQVLGAGTDLPAGAIVYDNFSNVNSTAPSGLISGLVPAGSTVTPICGALDDITLAAGGSRAIFAMRFRFATAANIAPNATFSILWFWYDGFNSGAVAPTPVNSIGNDNFLGFVYGTPPTTGWATGAAYQTGWLTSDFTGNVIDTLGNSGALEVNVTTLSAGAPTTIAAGTVGPIFNQNPIPVGSSLPQFWFNNNNFTSGTYVNPGSQFQLGTPPAPVASNLAVAFHGVDRTATGNYGACCLPNFPAGCVVLTSAICAAQGGVYSGNGTSCNLDRCNTGSTLRFSNGPLSTGNNTFNGLGNLLLANPANDRFSESPTQIQSAGDLCAGNFAGVGAGPGGGVRLADDFTVVTPATVSSLNVFVYRTGDPVGTAPVDGATLRIWRGVPNAAGSTIVYGDATTVIPVTAGGNATDSHPMGGPGNGNLFRAFATGVAGTNPDLNRRVWQVTIPVNPPLAVTPGSPYYVDFSFTRALAGAPFVPVVSVMTDSQAAARGTHDLGAGNALQFVPGAAATDPGFYYTLIDEAIAANTGGVFGGQGTCFPYVVEIPFVVNGTRGAQTCYANCDGSTSAPVLNALDFACFLNRYRANDPYANCDGSTNAPTLNALDFGCFLNRYRSPEAGTNCTN